jgi:type IV secretion system protein TrbC
MHTNSKKMSFAGRCSVTLAIALVLIGVLFPALAFAAEEASGLPYEDGLEKFQRSIQGPVPFAISLVGIVACGAMLIFGGEISGFMRTMIFIVLVIAVIVQAGSVVVMLGGDVKYDYHTSTLANPLPRLLV